MTTDFEQSIETFQTDGISLRLLSENKILVRWNTNSLKTSVVHRFFKQVNFEEVIRVYDVTNRLLIGSHSNSYLDIRIPANQHGWIIKGLKREKFYCLEIGVYVSSNQFFPIHRSPILNLEESNLKIRSLNQGEGFQLSGSEKRGWENRVSTYSYYENERGSGMEK